MKELHTFTDKIISDLDNSWIKNNQWVFPTNNFRFFNKDGKGLIASVVDGNEYVLSVTDNFCIVGVGVYNNIAYILSWNEDQGVGEIGTFPSPDRVVGHPTRFLRQYSPLMNLNKNGLMNGPMRTSMFDFSLSSPVDVLVKLTDDNTCDIFFCDYRNPNRVINSGFDQTGLVTTRRIYTEEMFDGAIYQFPITHKTPWVTDAAVEDGGNLKPGNYFLYLRYLNVDLVGTAFIKEVGPFMVANGNTAITFNGMQDKDWLLNQQNYTNKRISFHVGGIDTNFKYIQVGVLRNTGTIENGSAETVTWLINKYYNIVDDTCDILITGRESEMLLSFEEIILPVNEFNICRSQIQLFNLWLGATWKKKVIRYDVEKLKNFAHMITISEGNHYDILPENHKINDYDLGNAQSLEGYQIAENVYSSVGYFKGQIYPFTCKFNYIDGTTSDCFPLKGMGDPDIDMEYKGLFKFKTWKEIYLQDGIASQRIVSSVIFDATAAMNYMHGDPDFDDIVSITFMRGERIDNFICQGVLMRGMYGAWVHKTGEEEYSHGMTFGTDQVLWGQGRDYTGWDPPGAAIMPLFYGTMPIGFYENNNPELEDQKALYGSATPIPLTFSFSDDLYQVSTYPELDRFNEIRSLKNGLAHEVKHGIFSPDILFSPNIVIPDDVHVEFQCIYRNTPLYLKHNGANLNPSWYALDLDEGISEPDLLGVPAIIKNHDVQACIVERGTFKGRMNMSSRFKGDGQRAFSIDQGAVGNRDIGTSRYVGIFDKSGGDMNSLYGYYTPGEEYMGLSIVNLYRYPNTQEFFDQTRAAFNVTTTNYMPITGDMVFSSIPVNPGYPYYADVIVEAFKGDCFLQKSYFRSHRWYDMQGHAYNPSGISKDGFGSEFLDSDGRFYQSGLLIGLVTENVVNVQARNEVVGKDTYESFIRYSFYPKVLSYGLTTEQFAVIESGQYLYEATQINDGYNKVNSDRIKTGYNTVEIFNVTKKKNRVYVSDKENYRVVRINAFKDFCIEDGPITALRLILDYPYLVQEFGVNQIFVAERVLGQTEEGMDVIMGNTMTVLGESTKKILSVGSQHKSSIVNTGMMDFGVDFSQRSIWMITTSQTATGRSMLSGKIISAELLIEDELKRYLDTYSKFSDIIAIPKDDPLNGSGIVAWHDPEFKEVGFTFLLCIDPTGVSRNDRTYIFDARTLGFKGTYGFATSLYFAIGNKMFSVNNTMNPIYKVGGQIWKHNSGQFKQNFFGQPGTASLSFIINGMQGEDGKLAKIQKILTSLNIECIDYELKEILYQTLYQSANYIFDKDNSEIYLCPVYEDHKWTVPIVIQSSPEDGGFGVDSELQGRWCKVTIIYDGSLDLEIRSIEADYDLIIE